MTRDPLETLSANRVCKCPAAESKKKIIYLILLPNILMDDKSLSLLILDWLIEGWYYSIKAEVLLDTYPEVVDEMMDFRRCLFFRNAAMENRRALLAKGNSSGRKMEKGTWEMFM